MKSFNDEIHKQHSTEEIDREELNQARVLSGINFLLGIWLIISPYLMHYVSAPAKWNQTIFGIVVVLLSAYRYAVPRMQWTSWGNALVGIWMIIAPFILNYSSLSAYWNEIILGIIIAVLAFWNTTTYGNIHSHNKPHLSS